MKTNKEIRIKLVKTFIEYLNDYVNPEKIMDKIFRELDKNLDKFNIPSLQGYEQRDVELYELISYTPELFIILFIIY